MISIVKKYLYLFLAAVVLVYTVICDIFMTFSLSMNAVFFTAFVLLILLYYMAERPLNKEERGPSFLRIFVKVFSIFFFSGIIILIIFNVLYPKKYLNEKDQKFDYIIVFGAGVSENKTEIINSRIERAVEYSQIYPRCKFVLTGARGNNELIEEALYMRDYLKNRGIDDSRILIEPRSINTSENVLNSLNVIKKDIIKRNPRENIITRPFKNITDYFDLDFLNIGFMSSEFHLTRINMMAKKLGISRPYDIPCATRNLYKPYMYIREDLSLFKAFVLGQIKL